MLHMDVWTARNGSENFGWPVCGSIAVKGAVRMSWLPLYPHRNALVLPKLFDMVVVYDDEGKLQWMPQECCDAVAARLRR